MNWAQIYIYIFFSCSAISILLTGMEMKGGHSWFLLGWKNILKRGCERIWTYSTMQCRPKIPQIVCLPSHQIWAYNHVESGPTMWHMSWKPLYGFYNLAECGPTTEYEPTIPLYVGLQFRGIYFKMTSNKLWSDSPNDKLFKIQITIVGFKNTECQINHTVGFGIGTLAIEPLQFRE